MPEAGRQLVSANIARNDSDRQQNLRNASRKQEEVLKDLKALLEQMEKWAQTDELLRLARELLFKQQHLSSDCGRIAQRLGAKDPKAASKEEKAEVGGAQSAQKDCANDMEYLHTRMQIAFSQVQARDPFAAKNILDALKLAGNTDATPEEPDLPKGADPIPNAMTSVSSASVPPPTSRRPRSADCATSSPSSAASATPTPKKNSPKSANSGTRSRRISKSRKNSPNATVNSSTSRTSSARSPNGRRSCSRLSPHRNRLKTTPRTSRTSRAPRLMTSRKRSTPPARTLTAWPKNRMNCSIRPCRA
jgi:hypothetical protein